jgi:hypothetical protein
MCISNGLRGFYFVHGTDLNTRLVLQSSHIWMGCTGLLSKSFMCAACI